MDNCETRANCPCEHQSPRMLASIFAQVGGDVRFYRTSVSMPVVPDAATYRRH